MIVSFRGFALLSVPRKTCVQVLSERVIEMIDKSVAIKQGIFFLNRGGPLWIKFLQ